MRFPNIKTIRFSFTDFGPSNELIASAGNKVNNGEVRRLYALRNFGNENDRYPNISLNDQLDIFYEKCRINSDCRECVGFFHTQLMIRDEHELFCDQFIRKEAERLSKLQRKNKEDLYKKKNTRTSKERKNELIRNAKLDYDDRKLDIALQQSLLPFKSEYLEYELYYGYRHTIEFNERRSHWRTDELYQLEHLRYWSEEEKLWPSSSTYEEYLSEEYINGEIYKDFFEKGLRQSAELNEV